MEAFQNRGDDIRISHDIEDVVYILDKRDGIVTEIKEENPAIKQFIQTRFLQWEKSGMTEEILLSNLFPKTVAQRLPKVHQKIIEILGL